MYNRAVSYFRTEYPQLQEKHMINIIMITE